MFVRKNVYDLGSDWGDPILWYARAVAAMKQKPLSDPLSWKFYGAIHGFNSALWTMQGELTLHDTLPAPDLVEKFWNQCQHGSWYFFPWHRGYLWAFETLVRDVVRSLKGPDDWALPYWNYFGPNENKLPPAFASADWPDGKGDNPLFVSLRYGPNWDGDVFVPLDQVNLDALENPVFTGSGTGGDPGFGGIDTGFSHGGKVHGALESQPHDQVHGLVGGALQEKDGNYLPGLMSNPASAGLDPIFWLHHANIDRLWQVWREASASHTDPTAPTWLAGPGQGRFVMPVPDSKGGWTAWSFTPGDTVNTLELGYEYDDVSTGEVAAAALRSAPSAQVAAVSASQGDSSKGESAMTSDKTLVGKTVELVGASPSAIPVVGAQAQASVALAPSASKRVSANLAASASAASAQSAAPPERVFLNLENVSGLMDAVVFKVYVGPPGTDPTGKPEYLAGSVGLFGVSEATADDGPHGGDGLTYVLDVTRIVAAMHANQDLDAGQIDVRIVPVQPVPPEAQIKIGRVGLFRQGR